jgi:hypothetical protein
VRAHSPLMVAWPRIAYVHLLGAISPGGLRSAVLKNAPKGLDLPIVGTPTARVGGFTMESYLGDASPGQIPPPGMMDWLLRVADEARAARAERAGWGQTIDRHLRSHATAIEWRRGCPALKDTPHFSRYRSQRHHFLYDVAVRALGHGVVARLSTNVSRH